MNEISNYERLPLELKMLVLHYLPIKELRKVAGVSRLWSKIYDFKYFEINKFYKPYRYANIRAQMIRKNEEVANFQKNLEIEKNRPHPLEYFLPVSGMIASALGIIATSPVQIIGAGMGASGGLICKSVDDGEGGWDDLLPIIGAGIGAAVGSLGTYLAFIESLNKYQELQRRDPPKVLQI